jgi:hypothetical protein
VHHLNPGLESLRLVSLELGAADFFDPDGEPNLGNCPLGIPDRDDHDDGVRFADARPFFQPFVAQPLAVWFAAVVVTVAPGAPAAPRYLNVVTDADADGRWKNNRFVTEWVVRNARFDVAPGASETRLVPIGAHPFGKGQVWTRFTLTRSPIPLNTLGISGGWDGSGQFEFGESEDYLVDAGHPVDPSSPGPPPYNLDIQLPVPCKYFFGTACIPPEAGQGDPVLAISHDETGEIAFQIRAQGHPDNVGPCFVQWESEDFDLVPVVRPGQIIPDAEIGAPTDELGGALVRPDPDNPPLPVLGAVGNTVTEFEIHYEVTPTTDPPTRLDSRRIKNSFSLICCGEFQVYTQKSCALGVQHEGIAEPLHWTFTFLPGQSGFVSDPATEFGFGFDSPEAAGQVRADLLRGAVPYLRTPHVPKFWMLVGGFDLPLEDPPTTSSISVFTFGFTADDLLEAGIDPVIDGERLVVGRLDAANVGDETWTLDVGDSLSVDLDAQTIAVDNPRSFGQYAIGLPESFSPAPPGLIPPTVQMGKNDGGVWLEWEPSCSPEVVDYGIYRGQLGVWDTHDAIDCSDDGADRAEFVEPTLDDDYYLVVPMSRDVEGSYGLRSDGLDRPLGASRCRAVQAAAVCSDLDCDGTGDLLDVPVIIDGTTDDAARPSFAPPCSNVIDSAGVWYTVLGTGGPMTASTCPLDGGGAEFDTRISVYGGTCDSLTCLDGNNDGDEACGGGSRVTWPSIEGENYRVLVHGGADTGMFTLVVQ